MYAVVDDRPGAAGRMLAAPHASVERRAAPAGELRLARGRALFDDDEAARHFFEVVSGTVRCYRLIQDGRRQIHRFAGAGDLLGLSCERSYGYSAEAVTAVVARRYPLATLDAAMNADAELRRRVLQALRDELAATRTHMMLLGRMSAAEKLASFLLTLARRSPGSAGCVELPMTRSDIADYLGLTIETVSRKLSELQALGLIRLEAPSRIRITDGSRVEAIAEVA
jgi:CRP/FNR family transcriptional regulator